MSEKAMFYCFIFAFGSYFGTGYMALVNGLVAVATVSPVAYYTVWCCTAYYLLFILFAVFKGKTSKDTKHMSLTELYLKLRNEIFKQKQQ